MWSELFKKRYLSCAVAGGAHAVEYTIVYHTFRGRRGAMATNGTSLHIPIDT